MIVDGAKIIEQQLSVTSPTEVPFSNGQSTTLVPVRYTPEPDASRVSLDGAWQVKRWPFIGLGEAALAAPGVNDRKWETVAQPGKVFYADPNAEGQPIPNWDRVKQTHINDDDGAVMRRTIAVPAGWAGKRIYLRFDSIFPAGRAYINGEVLGTHLSGLTPVEYEVTGKVVPGQDAVVAVRLLRKHKYLRMDMVRHGLEFAGLAQSAYLFATEPVQVADYQLIPSLNPACDEGELKGTVTLRNHGAAAGAKLTVRLLDAAGKTVAEHKAAATVAAAEAAVVKVALTLAQPDLWNDEYPNLYTVQITLAVPGQATQTVTYKTGFRRLDLAPTGPKLNGRFIKFRGVNHLTYHPEFGLHTPKEWLRRNLSLMKKANVNCIRTHYLGPRELAEVCDELGMYLLQELPIDWGTNFIHDPEWVGPALMRIQGGILRDRHHCSVMVWSIGNENMPESAKVADDGWNHLRTYDRFAKQLDPSRATMFPPPGPANKIKGIFETRVGDIADTHYSFNLQKEFRKTGKLISPRSWEADMEETTREQALAGGWSGVWFSSEYGIFNTIPDLINAPYNSIIDDVRAEILSGKNTLQEFMDRQRREWGNMREDPACLGGAYFPWLCSGAGENPWGWVRWGEDADWGIITADLMPKPVFWGLRVLFSPVWFPEKAYWRKGEDFVRITIENQYNAIDLKDCSIRTYQNGGSTWMGMCRQFRELPVQCAPGETVEVQVPIWNEGVLNGLKGGGFGLCRVCLMDPSGFRPITADILMFPETAEQAQEREREMPIGPDAVL